MASDRGNYEYYPECKTWGDFREKYKGQKGPIAYWWAALEWNCERLVAKYFSRAWIQILVALAGVFAFVAGVVTLWVTVETMNDIRYQSTVERQLRAWEVINAATGEKGDLGRSIAVKQLVGFGESLYRVNLSHSDLDSIEIPGARLTGANLQEANLFMANLQGAWLTGANLQEARLTGANLQEAQLTEADLTGADLSGIVYSGANLRGANLDSANLQEANLLNANLQEAWLWGANLQEANLFMANLQEARLWEANLRGADLFRANLRGANLRGADLLDADLWGSGFTLPPIVSGGTPFIDLRGAENLTCEQLEGIQNWEAAYRDPELACGADIPAPPPEEKVGITGSNGAKQGGP